MSRERDRETKQNKSRAITPNRRKRINRLKKIILRLILLMILLPMTCSIVLGFKLYQASKTVEGMTEEIRFLERALQESMDATDRVEALLRINGDIQRSLEDEQITEILQESEVVLGDDVVSKEGRKVYLTFDDGPSIYTEELLDILAEYNVKATFFVTGKGKERYGDTYKRIVEEGHTLGMHSYSHEYQNIYASLENFQKDLETLRDFLYNKTGVVSGFYRFPGGSSNKVSQTDVHEIMAYLKEMGISYFDWNISAGDATGGNISSEQIVNRVMSELPSHQVGVILMHDAGDKRSTVDALPKLIEEIQKMEDTEILPITKETMLIQHVRYE